MMNMLRKASRAAFRAALSSRNSRLIIATALLAAATLAAGCGGRQGEEQGPQEPGQALGTLAHAAAVLANAGTELSHAVTTLANAEAALEFADDRGEAEQAVNRHRSSKDRLQATVSERNNQLLDLMTPAARAQTAEQWLAFLQRTENLTGLRGYEQLVGAMNHQQQRELPRIQTTALFQMMAQSAPAFFARFFSLAYIMHVEQDNRLLIMANALSGNRVLVAMQRDYDGRLLLMSEAETAAVVQQMSRLLQARLLEMEREAAENARLQAEEDARLLREEAANNQ
jgi:hypothetical protein